MNSRCSIYGIFTYIYHQHCQMKVNMPHIECWERFNLDFGNPVTNPIILFLGDWIILAAHRQGLVGLTQPFPIWRDGSPYNPVYECADK